MASFSLLLVGWLRRLVYFYVVSGGDVSHVCIALVLPHLHHVSLTFSRSFFRVCQFLICHFNGLRAQRLVVASSNSSVVSEAKF